MNSIASGARSCPSVGLLQAKGSKRAGRALNTLSFASSLTFGPQLANLSHFAMRRRRRAREFKLKRPRESCGSRLTALSLSLSRAATVAHCAASNDGWLRAIGVARKRLARSLARLFAGRLQTKWARKKGCQREMALGGCFLSQLVAVGRQMPPLRRPGRPLAPPD